MTSEKQQRLERAAKLLELIADDTARRIERDSKSAERLNEAVEVIRDAAKDAGE